MRDILQNASKMVWDVISKTREVGGIREDGITPMVLANVKEAADKEHIHLSIVPGTGYKVEKETGADWSWWIDGQGKRYMVQAKKLDTVAKEDLFCYSINLAQLNTLIKAAKVYGNTPIYVFYNADISGEVPENAGCTYLEASKLRDYFKDAGTTSDEPLLYYSTAKVLGAASWATLFG